MRSPVSMAFFAAALLCAAGPVRAQTEVPLPGFDPYRVTPGLVDYEGNDGTVGGYSADPWTSDNGFQELQPQTDDNGGPWYGDSPADNWLVFDGSFRDGGVRAAVWQADNDAIGLVIRHSAPNRYYHLILSGDGMPNPGNGNRSGFSGWRVYKHDAGRNTLADGECAVDPVFCMPQSPNIGDNYFIIGLEAELGTVRAYLEDVVTGARTTILSAPDSPGLPAGRFGVYSYDSGGGQGQTGFYQPFAYRFDSDQDGTVNDEDCAPADATRFPGAEEVCGDGVDQDCDGADLPCSPEDLDGDGFSPADGDCDDSDADVFPGASEVCDDGVDQDCNGFDLPCDPVDEDGDGWAPPEDCDDSDPDIHPGAAERCEDGIDSDCNGVDPECVDGDEDGDGFAPPEDCDDADNTVFPGAFELCDDRIDNNCDGRINEVCPEQDGLPGLDDVIAGACACGIDRQGSVDSRPALATLGLLLLFGVMRRRGAE